MAASFRKRWLTWEWLPICIILGLVVGGALKGSDTSQPAPITKTVTQIRAYTAAFQSFRDKYHGYPGDLRDARKLPACSDGKCDPFPATAGDNIIGSPSFIKTLKPQVSGTTRVPAVSGDDETILFWSHLALASMVDDVKADGIKNGSEIKFGSTLPAAKSGGGYIVGYADGTSPPASLSPPGNHTKGTIIVQISDDILSGAAELNDSDKQALTPRKAAQVDRKIDDGNPLTGNVTAFGAPGCFTDGGGRVDYNEVNESKDCNLIYRIGD
jgi:hypothetical protein